MDGRDKKRMVKVGVKSLRKMLGNMVCLSSLRPLGERQRKIRGDGQLS